MQKGDQITILKPVAPHIEGNGTITKVDEGVLKYEVEQWDIKQWYEENQITDRLIKVEPAPEFHKNICDQYKEAISEATEEMKGEVKFPKYNKETSDRLHQEYKEKREDERAKIAKMMWSNQMSTSTTMFPNGITSLLSNNLDLGIGLVGPSHPITIGIESKRQLELIKSGLALLAEQKQNELKEIEELIKKL